MIEQSYPERRKVLVEVRVNNYPDVFIRHAWLRSEVDVNTIIMDQPLAEVVTAEDMENERQFYERKQLRPLTNKPWKLYRSQS